MDDESVKKSKRKKMKLGEEAVVEVVKKEEEHPNAVTNFRISEPLKNALKAKGIEALFPIQARTFTSICDGLDLIGKAKTGQLLSGLIVIEWTTTKITRMTKCGIGKAKIMVCNYVSLCHVFLFTNCFWALIWIWLKWNMHTDESNSLWSSVTENDDDLSYVFNESTLAKSCGDLTYQVTDNDFLPTFQ